MATTTIPNAVTAVLDAAGIDDDDRGAIAGSTQIEDYFAPDAKALLHLRHLEETEAGFLLVTGAGKVTFESVNTRNTRMRSRQAQATITDAETYGADDLLIIPPPKQHDPMKDIANIVTVRVRRWSEASEAELWRLGETVELQAGDVVRFQVAAGGSASGRDPVTGRYSGQRDQAVADWIEPAANTDYTANTQAGGGGADRTGSVGIEFAGAGTSAMLTVENEHASDAIYVTLLKVRGQLLDEEEPIVLELRDEDSIADYGPRPYTVASELLSSVIEAPDLWPVHPDAVRAADAQGRSEDGSERPARLCRHAGAVGPAGICEQGNRDRHVHREHRPRVAAGLSPRHAADAFAGGRVRRRNHSGHGAGAGHRHFGGIAMDAIYTYRNYGEDNRPRLQFPKRTGRRTTYAQWLAYQYALHHDDELPAAGDAD